LGVLGAADSVAVLAAGFEVLRVLQRQPSPAAWWSVGVATDLVGGSNVKCTYSYELSSMVSVAKVGFGRYRGAFGFWF
jgi:hypothetical protein